MLGRDNKMFDFGQKYQFNFVCESDINIYSFRNNESSSPDRFSSIFAFLIKRDYPSQKELFLITIIGVSPISFKCVVQL